MSRGTKSKAVSGEKDSPPQNESESGKMEMADYFRMLTSRLDERQKIFNNRFDEQEKRSDSHFEAFQKDLRNTIQRLEELQLRVPRPRLADVGVREGSPVSSRESPPRLGKEELPSLNCSIRLIRLISHVLP